MAISKQNFEPVSTEMEIDESLPVQEKSWLIQRICWIIMGVFVILAAIGLFGDGPISKRKIDLGQQQLEYQQFNRYESRMELKFDLVGGGGNIVSFPSHYLEKFLIESIVPEPKQNQVSRGRVNYIFEGTGPMTIIFYLVPQGIGRQDAQVLVNNRQFNFHHFIYP